MNWLKKFSEKQLLLYDVGISKYYFPKNLWPQGIQDFFEVVQIKAYSRTFAAQRAWKQNSVRWLNLMEPKLTQLPRKISLYVGETKGTPLGRLDPILVYEGA